MAQGGTAVTDADRVMRKDAQRNRDLLLSVAAEKFTESGVDVPLEDIAREAGVGIGTLYRHFPTRPALIEAFYRREVAQLLSAQQACGFTMPARRCRGDRHSGSLIRSAAPSPLLERPHDDLVWQIQGPVHEHVPDGLEAQPLVEAQRGRSGVGPHERRSRGLRELDRTLEDHGADVFALPVRRHGHAAKLPGVVRVAVWRREDGRTAHHDIVPNRRNVSRSRERVVVSGDDREARAQHRHAQLEDLLGGGRADDDRAAHPTSR